MMTLNYHSKYAAASILFIFIEIWFWCFDLLPSVKEFILTSYGQNPKNCLITILWIGKNILALFLIINAVRDIYKSRFYIYQYITTMLVFSTIYYQLRIFNFILK